MSITMSRRMRNKLSPDGGVRVIPVPEYLAARATGSLDGQAAFYKTLFLRNGVSKLTAEHRLDDLLPLLVKHAPSVRDDSFRVLDVGCSAGVSTVELHSALIAAGLPACTTGTDLILHADYVVDSSGVGVLFDPDGAFIQIDIGRWATPWIWRRRDWVFRPLLSFRARQLAAGHLGKFQRALHEAVPGYSHHAVPLTATTAEMAAGVRFQAEDIGSPTVTGPFAIIRAANILNRGYFDSKAIRHMGELLTARLIDGGLLAVVRSEPVTNVNRGTIFRRGRCGLEIVENLNGGSEVADLLATVDVSG